MDMDSFENDPAADFLNREKEVLGEIIEDNKDFSPIPLSYQEDFELINNEIQQADAQSDELVDDLAGMSFTSTPLKIQDEVPEKIRAWREEKERKLEEKDRMEQDAKESLRIAAQKEMSDWSSKYNESMDRTKEMNRQNEKEYGSFEAQDNDAKNMWESIAGLCDFSAKGPKNAKDASRMRSIFLQMKSTPKVN